MKDFSPLGIENAAVGFPARLCTITRKDGVIIRFAESDVPVTVEGDTYQIMPGISVSAVTHSANGDVPSCQIVAVHENGGTINTADIDAGLFDGANVQVHIIDRLNLSRKGLLFTGRISTINYNCLNGITLDAKGPAVDAKILMVQKRSPMCRTDLFSVLCGVPASSYDVAATVASVSDAFTFTVSGLAQADGWFNQGTAVLPNGVAVEIANWVQSTQTITTYLPCQRLVSAGMALTLYPGCDKTLTATGCIKYANALNFQGEPHFLGTSAAAQQVS